jgi:hypothetical protein
VHKGQMVIWAILTFCLSLCLFAVAMPLYNREKTGGSTFAPAFLLAPFAGGAIYSARLKKREPVSGILLGFAVEALALMILILISASAHY